MAKRTLLVLLLLLITVPRDTEANVLFTVGTVVGLTKDIIQLIDLFQKDDDTPATIDVEAITNELSEEIEKVSVTQYAKIVAHDQFLRLDEIQRRVDVGLKYLKRCIEAPENERQNHWSEFLERASDAFDYTKGLASVLQFETGGKTVLDHISEVNRCKPESLEAFKEFCVSLLMDGEMLEHIHYYLKYETKSEQIDADWTDELNNLILLFDGQTAKCRSQFRTLLDEDVRKAKSARQLHEDNDERYPWLWTDVFFIKSYAPGHLFYFNGSTEVFRKTTDANYHKVVIFDDRNTLEDRNRSDMFVSNIRNDFLATDIHRVDSAAYMANGIKDGLASTGLYACVIGVTFNYWDAPLDNGILYEGVPNRRIIDVQNVYVPEGRIEEYEVVGNDTQELSMEHYRLVNASIYFYAKTSPSKCSFDVDVSPVRSSSCAICCNGMLSLILFILTRYFMPVFSV